MTPYAPPPSDTNGWVVYADHLWVLASGIGTLILGIVVLVYRRLRWADQVTNELRETRLSGEAAMRLIQDRQARWEIEVSGKIASIHNEFRDEFHAVNNRIDNVLINK